MLKTSDVPPSQSHKGMPLPEFIGLIALMMALTALSVDIMLPALADMSRTLQVGHPNERQLIITFYLLGYSAGQFVFGPLSDHFGRKKPLYAGLLLFAAGTLLAIAAWNAPVMFMARVLQGIGAASPRVIAIAIVRDRFAGRRMARVMSFVMMVFITVPILAPAIGQAVLTAGPWPWIFLVLLAASLVTLVWSALRLPETHGERECIPLTWERLRHAIGAVVTTRQTVGYATAFGMFFGALMSYVGSAEQIFTDVYGLGTNFPLVFGGVATVMIPASFLNTRLVERLGMRRVSHLAVLGFLATCLVMAFAGFPGKPPLPVFCLFAGVTFFCFGLIAPNFNALCMEPMGEIAGTASSFVGFYTTGAGALLGWLVGQSFDGTVRPLVIGFTALAAAALIVVLVTERGAFAHSHPEEPGTHDQD